MALSPQWAQSVVVRSDGGAVVQPSHSRTSAHAYAASGRPIIVRKRDPRHFTSAAHPTEEEAGGVPFLHSLLAAQDVSLTFWIPDPTRQEVGLLESIHRRTSANRTHVLLHGRPLLELQCNFSTCTGDNIDLSHDAFRLSKTSMALLQMERNLHDAEEVVLHSSPRATPQLSVSGKAFKDQLRHGLRAVQEEDYYLVRYRDYSTWAVRHYASMSKKDHFWGRKYVEQCFVVHVGKEPGELIPITEAQFLFGVELLQRQLLGRVGMGADGEIHNAALSADQFRSLGVLLGDGMRDVMVDGEEQRRAAEAEAEAKRRADQPEVYIPPSMWDWTPGAIKRRIDHQLQRQYQTLGRLVVRGVVLGVVVYMAWGYVRPMIRAEQRGVGQRRGRRGGRAYDYPDDGNQPFVPGGFLRSVMMGPKEVFDYMLAPTS